MADLITAYIGLGSNLGDRAGHIKKALASLSASPGIQSLRASDMIETAPLANADQPQYINAVAELTTSLSAQALHKTMIDIENSLGRTRDEKWSPRTIDLDLLLFGPETINTPDLTIPHPQMHLRSFVLKGLCQLTPDLNHPLLNVPASQLAQRLNSQNFFLDPDTPQLISIAGIIGVGKTTLTQNLAAALGCPTIFESYDTNPFLAEVYAGKTTLALDSELYFLTSRTKQLDPAVLKPARTWIADYIFDKQPIYAKRLLKDTQLAISRDIYAPLAARVAAPTLVINLRDSAENCLTRIASRNRPYEQQIETEFLQALACDYDKLFDSWKTSPVIRLDVASLDLINQNNINNLADQIKRYITA